MNITLWICQTLLSIIFTMVGIMKLFMPVSKLSENMKWVNDFPTSFIRGLGLIELVIGLLILLPRIIKSIPSSGTIYLAYSIIIIMLGAIVLHIKRAEYTMIVSPLVFIILSILVIYFTKSSLKVNV
ncbi:MAG: DoxX family protein [Leadbetterella sp.]